MKALMFARKTLLEYLREPLLLGLIFLFPVLLLSFYAIAFGETEAGMSKFMVVYIHSQDAGVMGEELIDIITAAEFDGKPTFDVRITSEPSLAAISLREHKAALLMDIPPDFSEQLTALQADPGAQPPVVTLHGDSTSDAYRLAESILQDTVRVFSRQAIGQPAYLLDVNYQFLEGTGTMNDFQVGVPGLIVFGVMFTTVSTAMTLVREEVNHTIQRLRLSAAKAWEMLLGVGLAQMVLAAMIVPFTFYCAIWMGFHNQGSMLWSVLVGLLYAVSSIGLGLITACFARNDGEAANLAAIIGVMSVLLSGAMYPMPQMPLFTIAGQTVQVYDILPPAHATVALQRILLFGERPGDFLYPLISLAVLGGLTLTVGVVLYRRLRLKRN